MKSKKKRGKRHGFLGFERNMLVFQLAENTHRQRVSISTKKVEKIVKVCLHSSQSLQVYCLASISQFCFDIKFQNSNFNRFENLLGHPVHKVLSSFC